MKVVPSSSTNRRAAASASSWPGPATTTRAPSASIASTLFCGTLLLMQMVASMPSRRLTWATARPWFPLDTATTPFDRSSSLSWSRALAAPRTLNEPVSCSHSSLNHTSPSVIAESASERTSGVRLTIESMRPAAARTSSMSGCRTMAAA